MSKGQSDQGRFERTLWGKSLASLVHNIPDAKLGEMLKCARESMAREDCSVSCRDKADTDPAFREIQEAVFPRVALFLLHHFRSLIDSNIMSADEVALDISLEAIWQGFLRYDLSRASDCSFISFCRHMGKVVAWKRVPESCPVSFVSSGYTAEPGSTVDQSYKYPLKLRIERFRTKHYQENGQWPDEATVAARIGISCKMVRELMELDWVSLTDLESWEKPSQDIEDHRSPSAESVLIEEERTRAQREKFSTLNDEERDKLAIAAILSVLDGRRRELTDEELEVLDSSLAMISWSPADKSLFKECLMRGVSRRQLAVRVMSQLGRSRSENAIRQFKKNLKKEIGRIFGYPPSALKKGRV